MFIEKFVFENYRALSKILNNNVCEYNFNRDEKCIELKTATTIDTKPEKIYKFYDFDVKCHELKFFEKEDDYHYVSIPVERKVKDKYFKYMKETFKKDYTEKLNDLGKWANAHFFIY